MSEPIPATGGNEDEARGDFGKETAAAAPVRAMVGRDEHVRSWGRAARQERRFSGNLEISREENRGAVRGSGPEDEASIVERTVAIGDAGMQHLEIQTDTARPVASSEPADGDTPRDRIGDDDARDRVALGAFADPELAHLEVAKDGRDAAGMIVVIVRQREDLQTAAAQRRQLGNDDAVPGVEVFAP